MQLKATLYYYLVNMRYILLIFWSILLGIMILSLAADFIFRGSMNVYYSFSVPTYIIAGIMGFWIVKNVIPYLVKMGITRLTIFLGSGIAFLLFILFNSLVANGVQSFVTDILGSNINSGVELTMDGKVLTGTSSIIELFAKDTFWNRFVIDVSIQFFFMTISFFFGLIFYRYKLIGGSTVIAVLLFIFIYSIASGWLYERIIHLLNDFSMLFFYQLFGVGIIVYLISHLLCRRLTI